MNIKINRNMQCEIDQRKSHCREEEAHCHITRNGQSVAIVSLDPLRVEAGHLLECYEIDQVLKTVSDYKFDLIRQYDHIRNSGSDY